MEWIKKYNVLLEHFVLTLNKYTNNCVNGYNLKHFKLSYKSNYMECLIWCKYQASNTSRFMEVYKYFYEFYVAKNHVQYWLSMR